MDGDGWGLKACQNYLDIATVNECPHLPERCTGYSKPSDRGFVRGERSTRSETSCDLHDLEPTIDEEWPGIAIKSGCADDTFVAQKVVRPPWTAALGEIAWCGENYAPKMGQSLRLQH